MLSSFEVTNVTKQVPVFTTTIEYEGLADLIKDHRKQYPEGYRSNVRAWRSDWFTNKKDTRFQPFVDVCLQACHFLCKEHFQADANLICSNMWVMEYEGGDHTKRHDHFPDVMSCVYYVDVEEGCAPIVFEGDVEVTPKKNLLVFYTSILQHEVPVTDTKRTVISMNFRLSNAIPNIQYHNGYSRFY